MTTDNAPVTMPVTDIHAPLATHSPDFDDMIVDSNGEHIAQVIFGDYIERMRVAHRIVVCVNACAEMDEPEEVIGGLKYEVNALKQKLLVSSKKIVDRDEKIEKMEERLEELEGVDEVLKAVWEAVEDVDYSGRCEQGIYVLKKQRDELFIALDEVCDLFAFGDLSTERIRAVYDKARHVVAKVRGVQL